MSNYGENRLQGQTRMSSLHWLNQQILSLSRLSQMDLTKWPYVLPSSLSKNSALFILLSILSVRVNHATLFPLAYSIHGFGESDSVWKVNLEMKNPFHFNRPTQPEDFLGRRTIVEQMVED